uniref:Cell wall hydroxyproline-rich glycoprotein n=1 Tax=Salix viminalis TaxID=40686 RepID=A0A6N2MLR9_SALVM
MEKSWLLAFTLFLHVIPREAAFGVSGGVGLGIGNAGSGVWIGGGISNTPTPSPGSSASNLNSAHAALQSWKSAITDDPLKVLDTWVGSDVCAYKGVFCADPQDDEPGPVVVGIDLNHANLQGTLVKEISVLTDMSLLHLNSNRFSGTLPDTFRDLISLQELDLSNNHFSGPFPTVTLYIPNLMYLDLRFNSFSGPIPEDVFNKKLDAIFLNNNQFDSQIPQNLGNSPASVINLANNKLMETFQGVGLFTEMQVLDVSYNSLMGHLPDTISCLNQIEVLNLAHNKLSGQVPELVCSLKSLANLTVAYNFFSGLSQDCAKLFFRNVGFDFSLNCIPGRDMQRPQPECSVIPGGGLSLSENPFSSTSYLWIIGGDIGSKPKPIFSLNLPLVLPVFCTTGPVAS